MIKTNHKKYNIIGVAACIIWCLLIHPLLSYSENHPLYAIGSEQFEQKHFDSAIITFSSIILEFPGNKEAFYNRGLSYYQLSDYQNAISDFDSCLKIDTDFKDAAVMKAMCLQSFGQLEKAQQELNAMNARHAGYDGLAKQITYNRLSLFLSKEWYYLVALFLLAVMLATTVIKGLFRKNE